ncbi:MAG: phosphoribosyltransferase [Deltaproteobacteria bacterium]|nr:phosphoribosyltransferase [Deltaproteobacteria bacterium]MBI3079704.1 phosphoribosyltransferase [Deltaproteobacteria bacterium]
MPGGFRSFWEPEAPRFATRVRAGEQLAERLATRALTDPIVLGIPRGGLPVGVPIAQRLGCPLDAIVLRKVPVPWSPEMGYGAVTLDATRVMNAPLLRRLKLTPEEVDRDVARVYEEVLRRDRIYREGRPFPPLQGRSVILTDDGLATGYTMLAAVVFARKHQPQKVLVAVPVSSDTAAELLRAAADDLICLYVSEAPSFAVANFYEDFSDMTDEEVLQWLKRAREPGP